MNARLRRLPLIGAAAVVLILLATAVLYWFQPWRLLTDRAVEDTLAVVPTAAASPMGPSAGPATPASPSGPAVVRQGEFVSHEHRTAGAARVVRHPDGSHVLELVGLDTSDGPDLRVWLSDQPVIDGRDGWFVFDDGEWAELGPLKGNRGDQTYAIPAGTDLDRLDSVTIWCQRFSVSFGAADLAPAT
ncbi:DM13 domain-containing protein [Catenuloplanes atrovinosus]|uniref:DM13 domain-containing protein n=1 Tax=Catenuloplanes atrovinosus TaxID=137266 RepID=A0AAE4C8P9_9ACTN|nr:DM13 domain-containing protein [Catenuloplanes atrovinosus]MDR7275756.1 hypothetical protein [Catenuloplanes atrovinosus]